MATIPKRSKIAIYRSIIEPVEKYLWLPIKNPNVYSLAGLFLSVLFLFTHNKLILIGLLILVLLLDWLDGAVARRCKLTSERGYIIDTTIDRLSEGLMFIPLIGTVIGDIFFFFYLINNLLTFYAVHSGKHYLLALRFFYLLFLLLQLLPLHTFHLS